MMSLIEFYTSHTLILPIIIHSLSLIKTTHTEIHVLLYQCRVLPATYWSASALRIALREVLQLAMMQGIIV